MPDGGDERFGEAAPWKSGAARLLERILDTIADPVFVKDANHRWVVVNEAFCAFMGHPREALLGRSDFEFFPRDEAETFWAKDAEVFASGGVNINEEPLTDRDGNRHIIVTKKSVFTTPEGETLLVGIIRDVTDLKRAEEQLRRSHEELERRVEERTREMEETQTRLRQAEKMEAIGQLTGGVAHDFNNLLGVILGSTELLQSGALDDAETSEYLETIMSAGKRASDLVRQLLAFSRPAPAVRAPLDLHGVVEEVVRILRPTIDKRIRIETRLEAARATIDGDRTALQAALLNLGVNARDAMPDGGTLRFETSDEQGEEGAHIELRVEDTGEGIPEEQRERVFEPFFTTKPVGKGSGLGLAAVYGTVQAHQGSVVAENAPGAGARFRIRLPLIAVDPADRAARGSVVPGRGRILIVDDEPEIRRVARTMLESAGYDVETAAGGDEALAAFGPHIDLVLLDYVMPGRSGLQVLRRLRERDASLPVVMVSGFQPDDDEPDPREEGAASMLRKPFLAADLTRAVADALAARPS